MVDLVVIIFLTVLIEFAGCGEINRKGNGRSKWTPNNFKAEDWIGTVGPQPCREASSWFI